MIVSNTPSLYAHPQLPLPLSVYSISPQSRCRARRKRYLDATPSYFAQVYLSLLLPGPYKRLVARHMTAAERRNANEKQNIGDALLLGPKREGNQIERAYSPQTAKKSCSGGARMDVNEELEELLQMQGKNKESKADAWNIWAKLVERWFVAGLDVDFDYKVVDDSDVWDDLDEENRQALEKWLEDEEPRWEKTPEGETGVCDF